MYRRISASTAFSIALHMAVFAVFALLLNGEPEPASLSMTLVLDASSPTVVGAGQLETVAEAPAPSQAAAAPAAAPERLLEPAPELQPAAEPLVEPTPEPQTSAVEVGAPAVAAGGLPEQPPQSELTADASASAADSPERAPAQPLPPRAEDASASSERSVEHEGPRLASSEILSTVSASEQQVAVAAADRNVTAPELEPLSPKQEKMLRRKLRKWTKNLHRLEDADGVFTWKHRGQEYRAEITQRPAEDAMSLDEAIVEVSTEQDGERLTTRMRMRRLAFSHYAQFVNRWDPEVQVHNDELSGRFHSNTMINLAYSGEVRPTFHGKVTTSARRVNINRLRGFLGRDQIFRGGLETGVRAIRLPPRFMPFEDEAELREDQIHRFGRDTRLIFHADGSYVSQALEPGSPQRRVEIPEEATYLVAAGKAKLHIKGTVNGKLVVYSPERIVIEDDVVYAQDPEWVPDADDYLGLVSDKHVEVASPEVTGEGDLTIHASIYAKRRFTVRDYRARGGGLLYVYGSLTAGSMSASEPRYNTRILFDRRLEEFRPPGFPMTDRYELAGWDGAWSVEPVTSTTTH